MNFPSIMCGLAGAWFICLGLFCAYGAGISIEQVGINTQKKEDKERVTFWFYAALGFALVGFLFALAAGRY